MTFHVKNRALFLLGALLVFAGVADSQVYFGGYPSSPTFNKVSFRTPSSGSFTPTWTGCLSCSGPISYQVVGNTVTLTFPQFTGTGTATTFTATGVPAAITPTIQHVQPLSGFSVEDSGATLTTCDVSINSTNTLTFWKAGNSGGWIASGTRGFLNTMTFTYTLP